jgi:hypothetical protein
MKNKKVYLEAEGILRMIFGLGGYSPADVLNLAYFLVQRQEERK